MKHIQLSALQSLLDRSLALPLSSLYYALHRHLHECFPNHAIIAVGAWSFDLDDFASHDQCTIEALPAPQPLVTREWSDGASECNDMALLKVTWEGEVFHVLRVQWMSTCGSETRHWVLSTDETKGQAFFDAVCAFGVQTHSEVYVFEDGSWGKDEELFRAIQGTTLESLVLSPGLKEAILRDMSTFFSSEQLYRDYAIPWKRGVLFIGPPGNGKTHAVKGLINALGKTCLYVRSFVCEDITEQRNIRRVFEHAREQAPCILVLEDLDSLINNNNRAFFLNELDGFAENDGLVVLATTNHPDRLDAAIVNRPSRFDRKYHLPLPGAPERKTYLKRWRDGLRPELRFDDNVIERVVEQTGGFSFAYLKELIVSSTMEWASEMRAGSMGDILEHGVKFLREQMVSSGG